MNIDTLKEKLADIDADTLRDFIFGLYLQYPELSDKIEALTLANDPVALTSVLRKRIASLKRGRRFIDYRASFDFARELEATLADIESGLLERSPEHAFDLVSVPTIIDVLIFKLFDGPGCSAAVKGLNRPPCRLL